MRGEQSSVQFLFSVIINQTGSFFFLSGKIFFTQINRKKNFNFVIYDITMGLTVLFHCLSCIIYDSEVCPSTSQSPRFSVCDSFLFFCILNVSKYHSSESSYYGFQLGGVIDLVILQKTIFQGLFISSLKIKHTDTMTTSLSPMTSISIIKWL